MVTLNEKENLKLARALAFGSLRKELGDRIYLNGKHFVWLEKWGYDAGVLGTHCSGKMIVPVTADPDLAMEIQEKYPELDVQCGDPVEIVKRTGRVFSSMAFGFHRPFTPSFLEAVIAMLQFGLKEGGGFFLTLNFGDPDGDALLRDGYDSMVARAQMEQGYSDRRVLEMYYNAADNEDKKKILSLMANPEAIPEVVKVARDHVEQGIIGLVEGRDSPSPTARSHILAYSFLNIFRDRTYKKKFAAIPYEFVTIEDKSKENYPVVFGSKILRGLVGEKADRFAIRLEEASSRQARTACRTSADRPDLIKSFYDDGCAKPWGDQPFPWELYFSLEPEVVAEWRKSWLKD
jgi:hypothetical protein